MWNDSSCYKRIAFNAFCFLVLVVSILVSTNLNNNIAYAENGEIENEINENIDNILGDIDTDNLDIFIDNDLSAHKLTKISYNTIMANTVKTKEKIFLNKPKNFDDIYENSESYSTKISPDKTL